MIESTLEPAEITVRAYSEGLENAELRLVSENCGEVSGVSVVTENKFPEVCRAYTGEVPARLRGRLVVTDNEILRQINSRNFVARL